MKDGRKGWCGMKEGRQERRKEGRREGEEDLGGFEGRFSEGRKVFGRKERDEGSEGRKEGKK